MLPFAGPPPFLRHAQTGGVASALDPLTDVLVWLEFLTSSEYLLELLTSVHGLAQQDALARCGPITSHVRHAIGFVRQSLDTQPELSFLPGYYAILNLAKVYVLLSDRHADLATHRQHGARYDPGQASTDVLGERISLFPRGALALFYQALTGEALTQRHEITMATPYSLIPEIAHELTVATGRHCLISSIVLRPYTDGDDLAARLEFIAAPRTPDPAAIQLVQGLAPVADSPGSFLLPRIPLQGLEANAALRAQIRTFLLYTPSGTRSQTPLIEGPLLFPQELPIALLFFHMAGVVRYNPEFLDRIRGSRYWPLLATARRHAMLSFLLLFWSHVRRQNTILSHPSAMLW